MLRVAYRLENQIIKRWSEKQACLFEREIMIAMFCVRTLIEQQKLSEEVITAPLSIEAFPKMPLKNTTRMNNHKIDELFNLKEPIKKSISLEFLCNQIIHSYIIYPEQNQKKFTNLLVCSDWEKNKFLYFIKTSMICSILRVVGSDYSCATHMLFDEKRQDYIIRNYKSPNIIL